MSLRALIRKKHLTAPRAEAVDLSNKLAVVTGASTGSLGYATAKTLAEWGATVLISTRKDPADTIAELEHDIAKDSSQKNLNTNNGKVLGHKLDLCKTDSVCAFAEWCEQHKGGRLDILVNNAGVHLDLMSKWKEPTLTADGHEIHWRTNYLGTAHLTHLLLPLLQTAGQQMGDARIVNVVSQLHSRGSNHALFNKEVPYNSWQSYGLSKLGMIHFSNEMHRRYSSTDNIRSYCLHPGGKNGVQTNVAAKGLETSPVMGAVNKLFTPLGGLFMATAEEGAQTQIYCATSPAAKGGHYYQNCDIYPASEDSKDAESAARLWCDMQEWLSTKVKAY